MQCYIISGHKPNAAANRVWIENRQDILSKSKTSDAAIAWLKVYQRKYEFRLRAQLAGDRVMGAALIRKLQEQSRQLDEAFCQIGAQMHKNLAPFRLRLREAEDMTLSDVRQVQADIQTHLIHRPARDIIPPLSGIRISSYCN